MSSSHYPDLPLTLEEFAQLEPLWDKAIQTPAEVSTDEKHQLMEWPPRAEMEAKSLKLLGLSVEDLFQKAATAPSTLTHPECCLVQDNFRVIAFLNRGDRWGWIMRRPDLLSKKKQARDSILTPTELEAIRNVEANADRLRKLALDERNKKFDCYIDQPYDTPLKWIQRVIDQGDDKTWGYVFYHHRDMAGQGWDDFLEDFNGMLDTPTFQPGSEVIHDSKLAQFTPFDTDESDIDYLRQDFLGHRERGDLKFGILKNVFFLVTAESRRSFIRHGQTGFSGWFWAIDPDWSSSDPDEDEGYDGRLRINGTQVFWRFYEFMSSGEYSLKDIWRDFHIVNEEKRYPSCFSEPIAWHFTMIGKLRWPYA